MSNCDTNLPCTPPSANIVCSPAEVNIHRKVNLDHTPQGQETQQALDKCEEYKDIFSLYQGDIRNTKLLTVDIGTGDHLPIARKPYTLPLKHCLWVCEELEMLEKARIISRSVSPWYSLIVIVPKKPQLDELSQKCLCIDYCTLNIVLPQVVKAHLKAQDVLSLVLLPNKLMNYMPC